MCNMKTTFLYPCVSYGNVFNLLHETLNIRCGGRRPNDKDTFRYSYSCHRERDKHFENHLR